MEKKYGTNTVAKFVLEFISSRSEKRREGGCPTCGAGAYTVGMHINMDDVTYTELLRAIDAFSETFEENTNDK